MKAVLLLLFVPPMLVAGTNPVQKVLALLSDLEVKINKEGAQATQAFNEFSEWCEDRAANLKFEIKTGKAEVEELNAAIEHAGTTIQELNAKIEETAASLATDESDLKAATEIRTKESADFSASEKDLMDVIDTLHRAIGILEREARKGGAAMVQIKQANSVAQALSIMLDASMIQFQDASKLTALVQSEQQQADDDTGFGAPDPAAYESHSGSIIETLEGLLDKATSHLDEARQKEVASKHNFEMLKQSLEDEIKFAKQDMDEAKKGKASNSEAKASAEGDLAVTAKGLKEDIETQSTLKHDCMTKAQDYEAGKKSRAEELTALAEAKKVIADQTGGAEAVVYSSAAASFLQQSQERLTTGVDLANFEAVRFVRKLAEQQHDKALMQLARRMASAVRYGSTAGGDPFAKVRGLIEDMLKRLLQDAQADASHKAYCDKEMGETLEKKATKEAEIAKLSTKLDSMTARSAQLKDEVAALQKELADLATAQAEMTKMRNAEHNQFVANKADTDAGLEGIHMALKILREYYASDRDHAHEAADGAGGGIIGLLEVVESDFSKAAAEMSTAEMSAQTAYDRESKANEITKATKEQDVKYKSKEAKQLDAAVAEATSDREGVQAELSAVLEYKGHLVEMCVSKPETYAERSSRREAEIAGLKEALSILEGEAVFLQRQQRGGLRRLRA